MKLFGHPGSTCTRKVLMTLAETNTPYEFELVDLATGAHKKEPHLGRQPFGQVPALDDDGFAFFESRAICRYIAEKTGSNLISKDIKARALMEQWISIETSNFTPHAMKHVYHYTFHRPQEPAVLEAATTAIEKAFGLMEKTLDKNQFLAGAEFSLADICFMPYIQYALAGPVKEVLPKYPHVNGWWERVSSRPTWKKVITPAS